MRLIAHAQRDTGQSRHVADFLLPWWNAAALAAGPKAHPDQLGSEAQFQAIVPEWRPEAA